MSQTTKPPTTATFHVRLTDVPASAGGLSPEARLRKLFRSLERHHGFRGAVAAPEQPKQPAPNQSPPKR